MEQKKALTVVVIAVVLVAAIGIGIYAMSGSDEKGPDFEEVYDAVGNKIKLDKAPERIACTTVTATEMICDLGFRAQLVGSTSDSGVYDVNTKVVGIDLKFDYPGDIQKALDEGRITNIGTWYGWTAESVATSNPDLVIIDGGQVESDASRMTQLQSLGITCIVLFDDNIGIPEIARNYSLLGEALGVQDRANEINGQMTAVSDAIYNAVDTTEKLKVAHICFCYGKYYIYDMSSTMQVLINIGCENALPTTQSFAVITPEDIAAADIDLIILDDMGTGLDWNEVLEGWKADPVMGSVEAIKNDKAFCLEYKPFQSTSYDTVHFIQGQALLTTIVFQESLGIEVPNIITDDLWLSYIEWVDKLV